VIVCMEKCSRDVNGGYVAAFVSINGGSDHNAVGSNSGGGAVFLFVTGLSVFLAAISARTGIDASIPFLDYVYEGFLCCFSFCGAKGASLNRVIYLVVMELGELSGCLP
jgi:hypothetical protein